MRVLVTGAGGFIGSHLVETLLEAGMQVRALVHYNSLGHRGWLEAMPAEDGHRLEVIAGDVRDPNGMRAAMHRCEVVLHRVALIAIPYSYQWPDAYVDTNVRGTLNVLQAARDAGVRQVIHTSTSEVYGTARFVPITEDHPLQAQSPYSATKIGADQIATSFFKSFGTPVTILRPFNTYGPRQSARAVIPTIVTQLLRGHREIKLGALHPTRDFNFVKDTVAGFVSAIGCTASIGKVINLGSGFEVSIGDTVRIIAETVGIDAEIVQDDVRVRPANSEVERLLACNRQAAELLSWRPRFAGMEGFRRGLEQTVEWFRRPSNLAGYRSDQYNV